MIKIRILFCFGLVCNIFLDTHCIASESQYGNLGRYDVKWHGVEIQRDLSQNCDAIFDAYASVTNGNPVQFRNCFISTNNTDIDGGEIESLYQEWRNIADSDELTFFIGSEASLAHSPSSLSNKLTAISVMYIPTNTIGRSKYQTRTIFVRQDTNAFRLDASCSDDSISAYMNRIVDYWRINNPSITNVFQSIAHGSLPPRLKAMIKHGDIWYGGQRLEEELMLYARGKSISTWNDWCNYYNAEILTPPVVFDCRDAPTNSISLPLGALQVFLHNFSQGHASELLKYADASGIKALRERIGVDERIKITSYLAFPHLTKCTILLSARMTWKNDDYVMFFCRRESPKDSTSNSIALSRYAFREVKGEYLYSFDIDGCMLMAPISFSGASKSGAYNLPYNLFYEKFKGSDFPSHFYTIIDSKPDSKAEKMDTEIHVLNTINNEPISKDVKLLKLFSFSFVFLILIFCIRHLFRKK